MLQQLPVIIPSPAVGGLAELLTCRDCLHESVAGLLISALKAPA